MNKVGLLAVLGLVAVIGIAKKLSKETQVLRDGKVRGQRSALPTVLWGKTGGVASGYGGTAEGRVGKEEVESHD